jgi:hypothetical protein
MKELASRRLPGLCAGVVAAWVLAGEASPAAAEPTAPAPRDERLSPEPPRDDPPGENSTEPSPGAPTSAHDPSLTSGAGTRPPSPPITVRPGVAGVFDERAPLSPELLPDWSERRVDVVLVPARPGLSLRIRPVGSPADEERCEGAGCVARVRPGPYEISVVDRGAQAGSRELDLDRAERLTITPPDESARRTGLILGVTGSVLLGAGVVMSVIAYSSSISECQGDGCADPPPWLGPLGIGVGIAGGIARPIGWVLYGNNLGPRVERTPVDPGTLGELVATTRLRARVERKLDGLELGSAVSF